jgi:hypothetical protein
MRPPELSFGDPVVDRAVEVSARAYGDDLMAVFAGVCNRDRRCLSAAASGLARASVMSIEAAADAVGLSAKSVRVTRHRRMVGFLAAEAAVIADILGEDPPPPVEVTPLRREVSRPHCQKPGACEAKPRGYGHCRACEVAARPPGQGRKPRERKPPAERKPRVAKSPRRPAEPKPSPVIPETTLRKARFARRFIAAGWRLGETARLFDLNAHELRLALKAEA